MKTLLKQIYSSIPFKKQLFSVCKEVWIPSENIYKHLHFIGDFKVKVGGRHSFKVRHYGYEVENTLFWKGIESGWESTALGIWAILVKDSKVIFDIGANTGIYSLVAKAINEQATVVALEPIKRVFDKLVVNNDLNGFDIECLEIAASDEDGTAVIYDFPGDHTYSSTFHREIFDNEQLVQVNIPVAKLQSVIEKKSIERIDLMKIDVEGHEPAVLEGMGEYLQKFCPTILIEILTDEIGHKVTESLSGIGYQFFYIDESDRKLYEVNDLSRKESYNYLLCSSAVANKLHLF